jgi:malate/lactate dehydrogenase
MKEVVVIGAGKIGATIASLLISTNVIVQPYLEPYLGGDRLEAVRIGGFDKRCGV